MEQQIIDKLLEISINSIENLNDFDFVTYAGDNHSIIVKEKQTGDEYRICIQKENE